MSKRHDPRLSSHCPSVSDLAGYLDNTLSREDRERVEDHVSGCAACRRLLIEARQAQAFTNITPPKRLVERLKELAQAS